MKTVDDYIWDKPHNVDTCPMPKWAGTRDGRHVMVANDDKFAASFKEWQSGACRHERKGIIKSVNGGGQTCYNWFCANCGSKLSSNLPHELAKGLEKDVHADALFSRSHQYSSNRKDRLAEIEEEAAERLKTVAREAYSEYLESDHWEMIRSKVMRRAGDLCEGCLSQTAEHVHHLSYEHVGAEFAFELVALCAGCHARVHNKD